MSETAAAESPFDDIRDLVARAPDGDAASASSVHERLREMGREGDFGALGEAAAWLAAWQRRTPPRVENPMLSIFAGAHGVVDAGISLSTPEQTARQVDAIKAGRAPLSAIAAQNEVNVRVFELALDTPTPNIAEAPAMSERECAATMAYGFESLAGEPDLVALGVFGAGIGTAAAAVACALYGGAADYWVRPGPGVPKEVSRRRADLVDRALATHSGHLEDPLEALRCLGGRELAACAGAIIAARSQGVPVLLDGFATTIAAGVVHALSPKAIAHVRAAHATLRPAHQAALERVGLKPLLDLGFQTGGGLGAAAAVGLLKTACAPFIARPAE